MMKSESKSQYKEVKRHAYALEFINRLGNSAYDFPVTSEDLENLGINHENITTQECFNELAKKVNTYWQFRQSNLGTSTYMRYKCTKDMDGKQSCLISHIPEYIAKHLGLDLT